MQVFENQHRTDEDTLRQLKADVPGQDTKWAELDLDTIENMFVAVHRTRQQATTLLEKYQDALADDKVTSQHIRDSHRW